MRQFVNFAARRAFCPERPMASESWSSITTTEAVLPPGLLSSTVTHITLGRLSALVMSVSGSSLHSTTSMRSPCSSREIVWMRMPRMPAAPTGSIPGWRAETATLARVPASCYGMNLDLAAAYLGNLELQQSTEHKWMSWLTMISGPRGVRRTSSTRTRGSSGG